MTQKQVTQSMNTITEENWGKISGNRNVKRYTISNGALAVSFINFGAIVQRIEFNGLDMVVSLPEPKLYEKFAIGCIGATVGRYAGRISEGRFSIDGKEYQLTQNQNGNHLHGGENGFHTRLWDSRIIESDAGKCVEFTLFSPDGEEGYPGNLKVSVIYRITDENGLEITFQATSNQDTIINLTNHSYFNPNGMQNNFPEYRNPSKTDNSHVELTIHSDHVLELNGQIPTGNLTPVEGTPFDFRKPRVLVCDMDGIPGESLGGYDHTFVLNPHRPEQPVASAKGLKSGVTVEFFTDQPGAQLFTMGNPGMAFAFEAQHLPDSPNHPNFPSTLLRAGDIFRSRTEYRFAKN